MPTIPDEMLCEAFALLPFVDRVNATHVCKTWRSASLARPSKLWSCIVSDGMLAGAVGQQLERAKDVPVDVIIQLTDETFDDTIKAITHHLPHIRRLSLYSKSLGLGGLHIKNIQRVYANLTHPAPLLEAIEIDLPVDDRERDDFDPEDTAELERMQSLREFDFRIPTSLFAAHAPRLRKATWTMMELHPEGIPAFSGLTRFSLEGDSFLQKSHLAAIIDHLPCLKALRLEGFHLGYELPAPPPPATFCLEELCITGSSGTNLLPLLEYFGYRQIPTVTTSDCEGWFEHFVAPPRGLPRTLRLDAQIAGASYYDWLLQTASGYSSHVTWLDVSEMMTKPMTRRIFERLEVLVVPASLIVNSEHLPPLPNLNCLSLVCTAVGDDVRLLGKEPQDRRPVCPRLRELEFWGRTPPEKQLVLSADDLELFMQNVFAFRADGRPHVTLRNARIDTTLATGPDTRTVLDALNVARDSISASFANDWHMRWHTWVDG